MTLSTILSNADADLGTWVWLGPALGILGGVLSSMLTFIVGMRRLSAEQKARLMGIEYRKDKMSADLRSGDIDRAIQLLDRVEENQSRWLQERADLYTQNLELRSKIANLENNLENTMQTVSRLREELEQFEDQDHLYWQEYFQDCPVATARVDADGFFLGANLALEQDLGYSSAEMLTMRFHDITHPEDLENDEAMVRDCLAGNRRTYSMVKRYRSKEGNWENRRIHVIAYRRGGRFKFFMSYVLPVGVEKVLPTVVNPVRKANLK